MKHNKWITWTMVSVVALVACGTWMVTSCSSKKQPDKEAGDTTPKYLVLYYSQTGSTKAVAEELQQELGADIDSIVPEEPYDGTYEQTIERSQQERQKGITPAVKVLNVNPDDYDVIFLGYPIWFGTYAPPVAGLLNKYDFAGKKVVPFCTFGSGGLETSTENLKQALPKAEIANGYGVRTVRTYAIQKEVNRFLIENGYIEGEVEALADYSEQQPVTDEEKAIFESACGDYKFPLGTPVTVGKRTTADGTDYCYTVKSDRDDVTYNIYVTVGNETDAKPEFTRVVR